MPSLTRTSWLPGAASVAIRVVGTVVLLAGVAKIIDLNQFARDLHSWTYLPAWVVSPAVFAVPLSEIALGGVTVAGIVSKRFAALAMTLLLTAFTALFGIHVLLGHAPECGCFGRFMEFMRGKDAAIWTLTRNGAMLLALVWALWVVSPRRVGAPQPKPMELHPELRGIADRSRGFTLVEILISIALVAILLALNLPVLRGIQQRASESSSLSTIRQHGAVFGMYTSDYAGTYPYFTSPTATRTILRDGNFVVDVSYFGAYQVWNIAMAKGYYSSGPFDRVFSPPGVSPWNEYLFTGYWYSCTMLARPEHWNPDQRRSGTALLRSTRDTEVRYPTLKVLLADLFASSLAFADAAPGGLRIPACFTDGSATALIPGDVRRQYPGGHGAPFDAGHGYHNTEPIPGMHTLDGVRGMDVRAR